MDAFLNMEASTSNPFRPSTRKSCTEELLSPASFVRCTTPTAASGSVQRPPTRSIACVSPLEAERALDIPELPAVLRRSGLELQEALDEDFPAPVASEVAAALPKIAHLKPRCVVDSHQKGASTADALQPLRVGIVSVSNAIAASGTHNVILGLSAFLSQCGSRDVQLWGLHNLGKGDEFGIDATQFRYYLNQAGSDLLPTVLLNRVNERLLGQVTAICERLNLRGLVFLCGPSELAEVARIADHFGESERPLAVAAVVHSPSGRLRLPGWLPTTLGFDSACSALAEVAGNIALSKDQLDQDTYHFVSCGSASLTLEVSMQIRPTLCLLGVDVAQRGLTLQAIVELICDVIVERHHELGLHTGVVMVSDDFFEQLVEMPRLRTEIHRLRETAPADIRSEESAQQLLPADLGAFFAMLPADMRHALVFRNDIHGMPLLKHKDAERELGTWVARRLEARQEQGEPTVNNFLQQPHSLRHLGWSPMPTSLDCSLGYALGHVAGTLVLRGFNGYVASMRDMSGAPAEWRPCAVPMVRLLKAGQDGLPTVLSSRLTTEDALFVLWRRVCDQWRYHQSYRQPGPVQYWGPGGTRPLAWRTYTFRAVYTDLDELASEVCAKPAKPLLVQLGRPFQLARRGDAVLSPLQRWRCSYQPTLPQVLRGGFRIVEYQRKGRICADLSLLHTVFMNLWRTDNLKAVQIESTGDEVSVMEMLPERGDVLHRDASWVGSCTPVEVDVPERSPPNFMRPGNSLPDVGSDCSLQSSSDHDRIGSLDFKNRIRNLDSRVGFVVLGKPGPGVNNVVHGLLDYLNLPYRRLPGTLVCIAMGIKGLTGGHAFELDAETFAPYRNQGGCDLLGHSEPSDLRHEAAELAACAQTCRKLKLDGLVVWGGRNAHSWTATLAEYFAAQHVATRVVGVPASTQSDLPLVEQTLGYDTVCKLFSSIVGNLATQAASSGKMWCFARIPGRSISQIAAEVALETHPHVVLMAAEMDQQNVGLPEVTQMICNVIDARSRDGKHWGVVLIPDQFLASVREMRQLFEEIEQILMACPEAKERGDSHDFATILGLLPPLSRALFQSFPERAKAQMIAVIHEGGSQKEKGALDLANVETEVIFQKLVEAELTRRVVLGTYKGTFRAITYSLPYHGRAAMPTNFDSDLGYTIGYTAGVFVDAQRTGLLVDLRKLKEDVRHWEVGGTPLSSLLTFQDQPFQASKKPPYRIEPKSRLHYDIGLEQGQSMPEPAYRTLVSPGPSQFEGPCADLKTQTLQLPQLQRVRQMERTEQLIRELKAKASEGCPPEVLEAVKLLLKGGVDLLGQLRRQL